MSEVTVQPLTAETPAAEESHPQARFLKDMVVYLPSKLLPALTGFITAPILTRIFPPAEYGNYSLALGVADFLFAVACSGIASVPVRFLPACKTPQQVREFFASLNASLGTIIAITGAAALAVLMLLRPYLAADLYPLFVIAVFLSLIEAVVTTYMGIARAQARSATYTRLQLAVTYGGVALGLFFVLVLGMRIDGLLLGSAITYAIAIPIAVATIARGVDLHPRHLSRGTASIMWRYAWPLTLGNLSMWGLRLSDRYLLRIMGSDEQVGLYSVACNLSGKSVDMVVTLVLLSMAPLVVATWERYGRRATEDTVTMVTRWFLIAAVPAAVGISVLGYPFVALLTDVEYHGGYRVVPFIALSSCLWGVAQITGIGISLSNKTKLIAIDQTIAALVNVGLNLILIPRYGFVAAGFTTFVGYTVLALLQVLSSRKTLTWRIPWRSVARVGIAATVMGVAASTVYGRAGGDGVHVGYLLASIAVGAVVYFACLLILREPTGDELATAKRYAGLLLAKRRAGGS